MTLLFRHLGVLAALLATTLALPMVHAQPKSGRLVLLITESNTDEIESNQLASAIDAYLNELNIELSIIRVDDMPHTLASQLQVARSAAAGSDVVSVVWLERATEELLIYLSRDKAHKIEIQAMPGGGDGWETDCDAIATIIRSTLVSWLEEGRTVEGPPKKIPNQSSATPAAPTLDTEKQTDETTVSFLVSAGYAPTYFGMDDKILHGLHLEVGLKAFEFMEFAFSAVVLQSVDLDVPGYDASFDRWPLELSVAGRYEMGRGELGIRIGLVLDITQVRGLPTGNALDETDVFKMGFAPSAFARLCLINPLFLWVQAGLDLFPKDREYLWDGEIVLNYARVQFRGAVGLGVELPAP